MNRFALAACLLLALTPAAWAQPVEGDVAGSYDLEGRTSHGARFHARVVLRRGEDGALTGQRSTRPVGRGHTSRFHAARVVVTGDLVRVLWREQGGGRGLAGRLTGESPTPGRAHFALYRLAADGVTLREDVTNLSRRGRDRWIRSSASGKRAHEPTETGPKLGEDEKPFQRPELWPLSIASATHPLRVHYRVPSEEPTAREVLGHLEEAWKAQVDGLGFRPPVSDQGTCGPDERFDIYVWRGLEECHVDTVGDIGEPSTPHDDERCYMAVDPWGPYGGAMLEATLHHEFNHTCQAADDYYEVAAAFEMTSTFIEDVTVDGDDGYMALLAEFQERPDLPLDHDDDYETWFMYGSALYLHYVRDRWFDGSPRFIADLWLRCRNPARAEDDPEGNEPDFEDALDALLAPKGGTFTGSIVEFARWRWYTDSRDDGRHFEEGARFPASARVKVAARARPGDTVRPDRAPALLGSAYIDVTAPSGTRELKLTLSPAKPDGARWVVQAVPGLAAGSDGDTLPLDDGVARVKLTGAGTRTLIVTAVPEGADDPDTRDTDARFPFTLKVER